MKTIVLGRVSHPGKSYAYHLGYSAAMMSRRLDANPYTRPEQARQSSEFVEGYNQARADSDAALDNFMERRGKNVHE